MPADEKRPDNELLPITELLWLPQPVHLLALVLASYVGFTHGGAFLEPSFFGKLVYLTCFAIHFGAQFWMTFVSGLVLFFNLPRHAFGEVQRLLFPKYFCLGAMLGALTLVLFVAHNPGYTQDRQLVLQVACLCVCLATQLSARMWVVPPLLEVMHARDILETREGLGQEVGRHDPGVLRHCPVYGALHRRFRWLHATCAAANLVAFTCNAIHVWYLAQQLVT